MVRTNLAYLMAFVEILDEAKLVTREQFRAIALKMAPMAQVIWAQMEEETHHAAEEDPAPEREAADDILDAVLDPTARRRRPPRTH